jgi:hypothetical protein
MMIDADKGEWGGLRGYYIGPPPGEFFEKLVDKM